MTILIKRKVRYLTLNSSNNVDLAAWMAAQGINSGKVEVTIPAGEIIGGTISDSYALNIGNLSGYDEITVNIDGEVQGKGGTSGHLSGDGAIYSVYPLTINISATGAVRAGGGAGGLGGLGGYGTYVTSYEGPYYSATAPVYGYVYGPDPTAWTRWASNDLFHNEIYRACRLWSGKWYWACGHSGTSGWYDICRGNPQTGTKGAGGIGGVGAGYIQAQTNGSSGGSGTYHAGNGGLGGNGGNWGAAGTNGSYGSNGAYITESNLNTPSSGSSGTSGGGGGYSIYAYAGAATGIIVNNLGTINGQTYY